MPMEYTSPRRARASYLSRDLALRSGAVREDGGHLVEALLQSGLRHVPSLLVGVAVFDDRYLRTPMTKIVEGDFMLAVIRHPRRHSKISRDYPAAFRIGKVEDVRDP